MDAAKKEATVASMEQVTRLSDELAICRQDLWKKGVENGSLRIQIAAGKRLFKAAFDRIMELKREVESRKGRVSYLDSVRRAEANRADRAENKVKQLEAETHRWREAYEQLKQHHEDERRKDHESYKSNLRRQSAEYEGQIRKLMEHITLMTGGPVIVELPKDCGCIRGTPECKFHPPMAKSEAMDAYINKLPDGYPDWVRQGDIAREIHAPSC